MSYVRSASLGIRVLPKGQKTWVRFNSTVLQCVLSGCTGFCSKPVSSSLRAKRCWVLHDNDTNNLIERGKDCHCKNEHLSDCAKSGMPISPVISGTYGGWWRWSRVGTELQSHDTKQWQSEVKDYVLKKLPGFSPPTIFRPQGKTNKQKQPSTNKKQILSHSTHSKTHLNWAHKRFVSTGDCFHQC